MFKVALVCISDARQARDIALELAEESSVQLVDSIEDILPSLQPGRDGREEILNLVEGRARNTNNSLFFRDFEVLLAILPGGRPEALQLLSALSRSRPRRAVALGLRRRDLVPPDYPKERVLII
jgi:hypothetical protein